MECEAIGVLGIPDNKAVAASGQHWLQCPILLSPPPFAARLADGVALRAHELAANLLQPPAAGGASRLPGTRVGHGGFGGGMLDGRMHRCSDITSNGPS